VEERTDQSFMASFLVKDEQSIVGHPPAGSSHQFGMDVICFDADPFEAIEQHWHVAATDV